jgi:P pilus assembly chaperone PapD
MKLAVYILSLALAAAAFGLSLSHVVPAAAAHKFHTSFTEADYDASQRSLQITLRTFPDDLENILSRRNGGKAVRLDRKREAEPLLVAYLQETFQLKNAKGETVKLTWVGMDAGVDSAWLYFEAHLPEGPAGVRLRNQFMFDLYDDQINLVNVKQDGKKHALTFKNGDNFQPLAPR